MYYHFTEKDPNESLKLRNWFCLGRPIIPIFANKRKKLRQALYANPSQEISSIKKENSYSGEYTSEIDDCLEMFTNDDKAFLGSDSNSNYTQNNSPRRLSNNNCNGYAYSSNYINSEPSPFINKTQWNYSRADCAKEEEASQNSRNSSTRRSSDYHTSNSYSKLGSGGAPRLMKHPNAPTGNNQNRWNWNLSNYFLLLLLAVSKLIKRGKPKKPHSFIFTIKFCQMHKIWFISIAHLKFRVKNK